ncbi:S1C family serine protease [Microbacterium aquimaris]|uniref:Trypsin-like peptidase domain-containing protein n=1 Tax=Microbacterium aquimaris TaxID=459816 RepID=A0ABU5N5J5_9MICO|nr:trypsin-like peptidase domain-containing protein [Microbacterium aquimaris]MDZ8161351.1 trypsin-like peptidase domain-containing protein [Microbacterium aquimaris]
MDKSTPVPADTAAPRPWYRRPAAAVCAGLAASALAATVAVGGVAVAAPWAEEVTAQSAVTPTLLVPPDRDGDPRASSAEANTASIVEPATEADDDESTGVVIIETVLGYSESAAAGSGIVLTEDGLILTNNHVIDGATEISVTIATTGETYAATLVGTSEDSDVALLRLEGAIGLEVAQIDDDDEMVGDAVTAVGNAEGGGVLMAADGEITALEASVTTSSTAATTGATLYGMIEVLADVVSGDSGGALLDAEGEVIGMTTAASVGGVTTIGYAVPIDDALAIVEQILAGDESDGVTVGYGAFLGVTTASSTSTAGVGPGASRTRATASGATIAGVIDGTPAADAGLTAGDTITAVDGLVVTDTADLTDALTAYDPGDSVTISWTTASGQALSATVTLIAGPA